MKSAVGSARLPEADCYQIDYVQESVSCLISSGVLTPDVVRLEKGRAYVTLRPLFCGRYWLL